MSWSDLLANSWIRSTMQLGSAFALYVRAKSRGSSPVNVDLET
jgi:hypothetical protein